jgi:hypothetical protein
VEETGVPRENHRPAANHGQSLSHKLVLRTPCHQRDSNNKTDCHDIIEILLKVALNTNQRNKPIQMNLEIDSERRLRTNYMTKEMILSTSPFLINTSKIAAMKVQLLLECCYMYKWKK